MTQLSWDILKRNTTQFIGEQREYFFSLHSHFINYALKLMSFSNDLFVLDGWNMFLDGIKVDDYLDIRDIYKT